MKLVKVSMLVLALAFVGAIAGCQGNVSHDLNSSDGVCQQELQKLMSDQPGFVAPSRCDSSLVTTLQLMR